MEIDKEDMQNLNLLLERIARALETMPLPEIEMHLKDIAESNKVVADLYSRQREG